MAGWRQAVELALTDEELEMSAIARSRSEAARRVERAQMLLAYRAIGIAIFLKNRLRPGGPSPSRV
jgi:hypothetical protein